MENPKRYGSPPPPGRAEHEIRQEGFDDIQFVRRVDHPTWGPVLVYTAERRGVAYRIDVGRFTRSDRLDVRSAPVRENPKKTPMGLLHWDKMPHSRGKGYSWGAYTDDITYIVSNKGHLKIIENAQWAATPFPPGEPYGSATTARAVAERHYAERYPLRVLAQQGEAKENPHYNYRSAVISMPSAAQLGGGMARNNPRNPFVGGVWYPESKVKRTPPPRKKKLRSPPLYPTPRQNPGYRSAVISKPSAAQLGGNPARRNMRKDMSKVLVTTPRHGHDIQSPDTPRRRRERITEEYEGPSRAPMKPQHGWERRVLNEYLNPLRRYLQSNAGRPWDEVYSEIREVNPPHSAVSAHIYEHLWDFVELHPVIRKEGVFKPAETGWRGSAAAARPIEGEWAFYVDYDGILREAPDPRGHAARTRSEKRKDPNVKKVDELTYLVRRPSDNVWFKVSYVPVVPAQKPLGYPGAYWGGRKTTPGMKTTRGLTFPEVKGHYPVSVRSLSRKGKRTGGVLASRNPGVLSDYDPREEQMRAQTAKIFRTKVEKGEDPRSAARSAFAIATKQGHRYGWYYPGTRTPTPRAAKASQQRYDGTYVGSDRKRRTLDDLIRNRQTYEKILGLTRQSGFYRVTEEPTREGKRYFVWPMPPGERTPGPAATARRIAETQAERLNRTADPRDTGAWPGALGGYTKAELSYWLPPAEAFSTEGLRSVAPKKGRKPRSRGTSRGTSIPRPTPDFSAKGEMREGRLVYFILDKAGTQVSPEFLDWDRTWAELQRRIS
jgi:hypothetical protein